MVGEVRVPVGTALDVVTARRLGRAMAARAGFSSTDRTLIATAISEVGRNILQHAGNGEIELRWMDEGARRGIRVTARDAGPGIANVTAHRMGLGLCGAKRLMDSLEVRSARGMGTTVVMTKWAPPRVPPG